VTVIPAFRARSCLAILILLLAPLGINVIAQTETDHLRAMMESPDNPLVVIRSTQGDIYLELFPSAAPQNVRRFLELANAQLPIPDPTGNGLQAPHYYDGFTFHRVIPGTLIQTGAPERANRLRPEQSVPDEINARALGLEQQRLIDPAGRPHPWMNIRDQADFQRKVLLPLYRSMNIRSRDELQSNQQPVLQRLQQMNLLQAHENMGYRYNPSLPSRRPTMGSVMMVNNGPGENDGEFFITVDDTPWLTGTNTVIGRVLSGLPLVTQISRSPPASVRIFQVRQLDINEPGVTQGDNVNGTINP